MSKLEQAARQALDMMEFVVKYPRAVTNDAALRETIAALREALAEQSYDKAHGISSYHLQETEQAEQEPVAWLGEHGKLLSYKDAPIPENILVYAAPVRTKDLMDAELREALGIHHVGAMSPMVIARNAIAADREKNK